MRIIADLSVLAIYRFDSSGLQLGAERLISGTALLLHLAALGTTMFARRLWEGKANDPCFFIGGSCNPKDLIATWKLCLAILAAWLVGVSILPVSDEVASFVLGAVGVFFALTNWTPYTLISCELSAFSWEKEVTREQTCQLDSMHSTTSLLAIHNMAICIPRIVAAGAPWVLIKATEASGHTFHVSWVFIMSVPPAIIASFL